MKLPYKPILLFLAFLAIALLADAWRSARRDSQQLAATLAAQNSILQQAGQQEKQRDSQLASTLSAIHAQTRAIHTPKQAAQKLLDVFPPLPLPLTMHIPEMSGSMPAASATASNAPGMPPAVDVSNSPHAHAQQPPPSDQASAVRSSTISLPGIRPPPVDNPESASGSAARSTAPTTPPSTNNSAQTSITIPQPDLIPLYDALQDCRVAQAQTAALEQDLSDEKARSAALQKERNAAVTAAHGGSILQRLKRAAKWFAIGAITGATVAAASHH